LSFGSIRLRLTLWYALALFIILTGSGTIWYLYLSRSLLHQVDERLLKVASELADYHQGSLHIQGSQPPSSETDTTGKLAEFEHRFTQGELLQVVNSRGEICCHSENILGQQDFIPLSQQALRNAHTGKTWFSKAVVSNKTMRIVSRPFLENDKLQAVMLVATPLEPTTIILNELLGILLISSPLAALAMLWGGWFLSGRALEPINRMSNAIRAIDVNKLNSRLDLPDSSDEITRLGASFNALLDRLQQAFTQIRQFTADASHELRTPLAILRGETEVTLSWGKSKEDYQRALESNLEEIDRMSRIIEDLLTLSRTEAGQAPLNLTRFSLYEFLHSLYEQATLYAEPRNIRIELHANIEQDVELLADRPRLQQALLNLITNAIKYSESDSRVELGFDLIDDDVVIAVKDHGIGIESRHLPHIFDRFYRVDEARDRDAGGAGIGLAITHWIVNAHHGHISVVSTPGTGSTFTIRLPRGPLSE